MEVAPLGDRTAREWVRAIEYEGFRRRKLVPPTTSISTRMDAESCLSIINLNETFGPKAIRQILQSTGWIEADLRRLGLLP
jgi:hypothetical protein